MPGCVGRQLGIGQASLGVVVGGRRCLVERVALTSLGEWKGFPVDGAPPCQQSSSRGSPPGGVVIMTGLVEPIPIEQTAAQKGFPNTTVRFLSKLFTLARVPNDGPKPTTEQALLSRLVRHHLPEKSKEEVELIIKNRCTAAVASELPSAVDDPNAMKGIEDIIDKEEAKDFQPTKPRASASPKCPGTAAAASSSAPALAKGGAKPPSLKKIPTGHSRTPAWARQYLTQATGVTITEETVR